MPEEKYSYLEVLPEALEWMEKNIMGDANARDFKPVLNPLTGRYDVDFDPKAEQEFMREEWDKPVSFRLSDMHEAFNIAGLSYRPA